MIQLEVEDLRDSQCSSVKRDTERTENLHNPDYQQQRLKPFEQQIHFKAADQVNEWPGPGNHSFYRKRPNRQYNSQQIKIIEIRVPITRTLPARLGLSIKATINSRASPAV